MRRRVGISITFGAAQRERNDHQGKIVCFYMCVGMKMKNIYGNEADYSGDVCDGCGAGKCYKRILRRSGNVSVKK